MLTIIFVYTTIVNIVERPEGLKIAAWFIVDDRRHSLVSRVLRSTELRVQSRRARRDGAALPRATRGRGPVRIIANRPDSGLPEEYEHKLREASESHHLPADEQVLFLEVRPGDASEFSGVLHVVGVNVGPLPRAALRQPGDPERDRRAAALHPRRDRADSARLLRVDRGQSRWCTC